MVAGDDDYVKEDAGEDAEADDEGDDGEEDSDVGLLEEQEDHD